MPTHLQKLDKNVLFMHIYGQSHETPVVLPGVQVSAAESLPTHTSQHPRSQLNPGAEVAVPL